MIHIKYFLAVLEVIRIATSLPVEEKIEPVDLAYTCINNEASDESQAKSPILLLHGIGLSKKMWNDADMHLAQQTKRRICAVDLRNHGDSPWNNRTDVETLAMDIGHFLDKLGINKVNIIGQSLGGKTAIHYSLNNPNRIDSIIAVDIRPNIIPEEAIFQILLLIRLEKKVLRSIPKGTSEYEAGKSIIDFFNKKLGQMGSKERLPYELIQFIDLKLEDGKWYFKHNMDLLEEVSKDHESFMTESTGLYEGPAMFIYGTKSPFKVIEDKENILTLFPNAQFVPIEDADHFIKFSLYEDDVISFLNKID